MEKKLFWGVGPGLSLVSYKFMDTEAADPLLFPILPWNQKRQYQTLA